MAIISVQQPNIREPKEKEDPFDRILKGLQIASNIYGIKTSFEQSELNELKKQQLQQNVEMGKRQAGLEAAGIVPSSDFNKEFRTISPEKISELETKSGLSIEPIKIRVEDPTNETGYIEVSAIQKDDLSEIRKLIKEGEFAKLKYKDKDAATNAMNIAQKTGQTAILPKKVDEDFSKQYTKYIAEGEEAKSFDTILKLEETVNDAATKLGSGLHEQFMGILPDKMRDIVDPGDKQIEDRIKSVAQTSLKQILGAQFTEKEGKQLLDRAYNAAQPKTENIRRMRELIRSLKAQAQAKKDAMDYFAKNGTLQGFKSTQEPTFQAGTESRQQQPTFQAGFGQRQQAPSAPSQNKIPISQNEIDSFIRSYTGD